MSKDEPHAHWSMRSLIVGAASGAAVAGAIAGYAGFAFGESNGESTRNAVPPTAVNPSAVQPYPSDGGECTSIFEKSIAVVRPPGTPDDKPSTLLRCNRTGASYVWRTLPQPLGFMVQKLITFDDHPARWGGDQGGERNAAHSSIASDTSWVGVPLDARSRCSVEQQFLRAPGLIDYPLTAIAPTGMPLLFSTKSKLYDIGFSGRCAWWQLPPQGAP